MRIPVKYIVQIDNFHVADFIFYRNYYEQPCSLLLQKPKTEGLTAIRLVVDSDEAASFCTGQRRRRGAGCIRWIKKGKISWNNLLSYPHPYNALALYALQ